MADVRQWCTRPCHAAVCVQPRNVFAPCITSQTEQPSDLLVVRVASPFDKISLGLDRQKKLTIRACQLAGAPSVAEPGVPGEGGDGSGGPIPVLQFKCTVCEKSFSTLKGLRVHASLKKHGRQDGVRVVDSAVPVEQGGDGDIGDSVGVVVDTDTLSAVRATLAVTFGEAGTGLLAGATGAQAAVASFSPRSGEGPSEPRDVGEFSRSLDGVSQDSRQVTGGASSGGQIHDGAAVDAPKFHTCPECARAFTSARGLTQHVRHAHRTLYNERIDVHRIKPRWDREEEYLLAKKEVELGSSCTNINQVLHSHFPSRSLEAIKSHRKDLNYRETVQRLAAETALRLTDSGAGSGGVCPRVVRTRELREGAPRSEGGAAVTTCPMDPVLQHRGALQSSPMPQSQLDFVAQGARPRRPLRSCRRDRLQPSVEVVLPESSGTSELPDPPSRGMTWETW